MSEINVHIYRVLQGLDRSRAHELISQKTQELSRSLSAATLVILSTWVK